MPAYPGFVGVANALHSPMADAEQLVNLYLAPTQSAGAPTEAALWPTPGQTAFAQTTDVETRAAFTTGTRAFVVVGPGFWELFTDSSPIRRGTLAVDTYPATISYNGVEGGQLLVTSGSNGYLYDLTTNDLSAITALVGKATMGGAKDGFFLAFDIRTSTVWLSDLLDGATWDPTQFFRRSLAPDPWRAMVVSNPEIWLIGEVTGEAWYNSGAFPQPFAPIAGAFFNYGTRAPFSVRLSGDTLLWLANTSDGPGRIVSATGYQPRPISSSAVDTAIAGYIRAQRAEDCETLVYQEDGHTFACFSFPSANATWAVDLETGAWHQRGTWNTVEHRYDVWTPRVHMHAFGKHLVGDRGTGQISSVDLTHGYEANGALIRRLRTGPTVWARQNRRMVVSRLELMMDTGLGLANGVGSAPVAMLRSSFDTRTWTAQTQRATGAIGTYGTRVVWTRLGSTPKAWFPEITMADPVPYRIAGCEIEGTGLVLAAAS